VDFLKRNPDYAATEEGEYMEHKNPLLHETVSQKFITFGEIMLRLTPPNYEKIRVATSFEASYGGSEANVALALANLGIDSTFFTVVPNNSLGKSAVRMLRSNDVHCSPVILSTPEETPTHRLGTYYLETGYGIRPSKVTYDRKHSAITEYDFSKVDLDWLLEEFSWLHLSGITPALSPNCARFILDCLKKAKEKGLTVSFDGNFRSTLWSWEEARDFCTQCLPYVDVLFGTEPYHLWRDENDHSKGDWKDNIPLQPSYEQQDEVFQAFASAYPNLKCIARHVRFAHTGSENSLMAYMWYQNHTFESRLFTFNILDRVGGGDAFASGLIYAMMKGYKPMDMINFAVASSAIKHTIRGDGNITDDAESIRSLMNMSYDIKR
jgi:2-dehydro-3-deoxygluconokinase